MQEAAAEDRCRYCGTAIEQPQHGGRQKLFCSDEHRLRYWREQRRHVLAMRDEAPEPRADVRSLSRELQSTLLGFQHTVQVLANTLADAGDLDTARGIMEQVEVEAQRRIAAAEERWARAERMRLEAEAAARTARQRLAEVEAHLREAEAGLAQERQARLHAEAKAQAAEEV